VRNIGEIVGDKSKI